MVRSRYAGHSRSPHVCIAEHCSVMHMHYGRLSHSMVCVNAERPEGLVFAAHTIVIAARPPCDESSRVHIRLVDVVDGCLCPSSCCLARIALCGSTRLPRMHPSQSNRSNSLISTPLSLAEAQALSIEIQKARPSHQGRYASIEEIREHVAKIEGLSVCCLYVFVIDRTHDAVQKEHTLSCNDGCQSHITAMMVFLSRII